MAIKKDTSCQGRGAGGFVRITGARLSPPSGARRSAVEVGGQPDQNLAATGVALAENPPSFTVIGLWRGFIRRNQITSR